MTRVDAFPQKRQLGMMIIIDCRALSGMCTLCDLSSGGTRTAAASARDLSPLPPSGGRRTIARAARLTSSLSITAGCDIAKRLTTSAKRRKGNGRASPRELRRIALPTNSSGSRGPGTTVLLTGV